MAAIRLRSVHDGDAVALYRWRNDPETRRLSGGDGEPIAWQRHIDWFCNAMSDPAVKYWAVAIASGADDRAVGVVRVHTDTAGHWISIAVDPAARGRGVATTMLQMVVASVAERPLLARIHQLNVASVRAFEHVGFALADEDAPWRIYRRS